MVCYFSPPPGGLAFADLFPVGVPDLEHDLDDLESCGVCGVSPVDPDSMFDVLDIVRGSITGPVSACSDCSVMCDICDGLYVASACSSVRVSTRSGQRGSDLTVCGSCESELARCCSCDVAFDLDEQGAIVNYDHFCQRCLESSFSFCYGCDEYTSDDVCGECDRCESCGCSEGCSNLESANERGDLFPYDYKPDPVFHGTGPLFLGFELEMETGNAHRYRSDFVRSISSGLERVYLKHDGSLVDGMELVTEPMSPASLVEWWPTFSSTLDELRSEGVTSWNGHRCGFHIHLSRDAFDGPRHLFLFSLFVYRNAYHLQRLSGRRSAELNQYARLDLHQGDGVEMVNGDRRLIEKVRNSYNGGARHVAVNLTNSSTVEIRLFRGTMRAASLRGYVELVLALFDYSASLSARDVAGGALLWQNFREWIGGPFGSYPALVALDRLRSTAGVS